MTNDKHVVQITAPSRLHFGLLSFGGSGRQFGGAGVMIERPALQMQVAPAERFEVQGLLAERVRQFAGRWASFHQMPGPLPCRLEVTAAPRQHAGLGVGTQLGLAVAAGLNAFFDQPQSSPAELAISVGRGLRSAVGTYGFLLGGLIVERGKLPGQPVSPLDCRLELPPQWRFVLLCPRQGRGLSGYLERRAFAHLPAVPGQVTERLAAELREQMIPAAAQGWFDQFSESVYRFGYQAGMCFANIQGGPYNGPQLNRWAELIRSLGVRGVGQSSWGPTLFALVPDQAQAQWLVDELSGRLDGEQLDLHITPPDNHGAQIHVAAYR